SSAFAARHCSMHFDTPTRNESKPRFCSDATRSRYRSGTMEQVSMQECSAKAAGRATSASKSWQSVRENSGRSLSSAANSTREPSSSFQYPGPWRAVRATRAGTGPGLHDVIPAARKVRRSEMHDDDDMQHAYIELSFLPNA